MHIDNSHISIKEALLWGRSMLQYVCERPQFEAELLLAYHIKKERIYAMTHSEELVKDFNLYSDIITRRSKNEPYEYIVGEASFYDISLSVQSGVLIPRPETEILIDITSDIIEKEKFSNIVEIGIGSGAISIVLARKFPHLNITSTDISDIPLMVAKKNIDHFNLNSNITLIKSNLIDRVKTPVELVVSNPPYVAKDAILKANVIDYEPKEALFGGMHGDELLKSIIEDVKQRKIRYLVCEMGYDQKESIQAFVKDIEIKYIQFYKDLSKLDRGFVIKFY